MFFLSLVYLKHAHTHTHIELSHKTVRHRARKNLRYHVICLLLMRVTIYFPTIKQTPSTSSHLIWAIGLFATSVTSSQLQTGTPLSHWSWRGQVKCTSQGSQFLPMWHLLPCTGMFTRTFSLSLNTHPPPCPQTFCRPARRRVIHGKFL